MVDAPPVAPGGDRARQLLVPARTDGSAVSGCSSIGHVMVFYWGLFQNLVHSGLEGFGLRSYVSRFNVLARQLRFQCDAQLGGAAPGILRAGGMIQHNRQQLERILHITLFHA